MSCSVLFLKIYIPNFITLFLIFSFVFTKYMSFVCYEYLKNSNANVFSLCTSKILFLFFIIWVIIITQTHCTKLFIYSLIFIKDFTYFFVRYVVKYFYFHFFFFISKDILFIYILCKPFDVVRLFILSHTRAFYT